MKRAILQNDNYYMRFGTIKEWAERNRVTEKEALRIAKKFKVLFTQKLQQGETRNMPDVIWIDRMNEGYAAEKEILSREAQLVDRVLKNGNGGMVAMTPRESANRENEIISDLAKAETVTQVTTLMDKYPESAAVRKAAYAKIAEISKK